MREDKVIYVVPGLPRLNADFGALVRHLTDRGVPTAVYTPRRSRAVQSGWAQPQITAAVQNALPAEIEHRHLPFDREALRAVDLARTAVLAHRIGRAEPGALFVVWTILPILACGLPLRSLNRRCLFLLTGLGSTFDAVGWKGWLVRNVIQRLYVYLFSGPRSRVMVHNHEDRAFLVGLGVPASHVTVTPGCGVDPGEYPWQPPPPARTARVILVPMRLLREKGVLDAVRASGILREQGVEHEMWFSCSVNPGNPSSLTTAEVERIQAENASVRFVGFQPRVQPLFQACDLVCIPTRYREGLPTALLETAASGRAVVATDNVGCRDFVEHEVTGLMVPGGDPAQLAAALRRLLEDEALADRLRRQAHQKFLDGFTKAVMVEKTLKVLAELGLDLTAAPAHRESVRVEASLRAPGGLAVPGSPSAG